MSKKNYVSPSMEYTGKSNGSVSPQCCDVGLGLMLAVAAVVYDVVVAVDYAGLAVAYAAAAAATYYQGVSSGC